ncbi:MAG: hypothetical protein ACQGVK_08975 [Myxococcota bacterium]
MKKVLKDALGEKARKRDLKGWTLTSTIAVSADGSVMVGGGIDPNGRGRSWIAHIPTLALDAADPTE